MAEAKPSEFFVGVVEFFGVLLPGAILLATGLWAFEDRLLAPPKWLTVEAWWAGFAAGAYMVGALLFLMGSPIDELLYDPWREARWPKATDLAFRQARALRNAALQMPPPAADGSAPGQALPGWGGRVKIFGREFAATWRKRILLKQTASDEVMNTLSWAKSVLMLAAPAAHADVLRYEAESKFYRSMILVALIGGLTLAAKSWDAAAAPRVNALRVGVVALGALAAMVLSFLRYAERRYKSTEWAYRYLIALAFGPKADRAEA